MPPVSRRVGIVIAGFVAIWPRPIREVRPVTTGGGTGTPGAAPGPAAAQAALRSFAEAHGRELRDRGQPAATMDHEGRRVIWIHPDGTRRIGRAADAPIAA